MEAIQVSINRVMDKDVVHIQWNISHKKEWNNAICSNVDRPRDYHIKWNLKKKKKKTDTNEHIYK